MKRILMLVLPLALSFPAMGQFTLSGRVTDKETGEALHGASVQIENTYSATICNEEGTFGFRKLKKGGYNLLITYLGYKSREVQIEITGDRFLEVGLDPSPVMQDEVVITATRAGEKSPTAYQNIKKAEIKRLNLGQDIPYILDISPSVVVTSDAGGGVGYTGLRIRGSDLTRINVTVNGIPMNDAESHGVFWVDFPDLASSIDNVQIQRGVGTSTNGAAAFGASINFQTNKLIPEAYAEINNSFGSFNTWKNNLLLGTGLIDGRWTFDGRISRISSEGYIDRATSNMNSIFLSGGYYGEKNFVRINFFTGKEKTYQAWTGVPKDSLKTNRTYNPFTYENQTDNYRQDNYQVLFGQQAGKYWTINAALHYTRGKGYYEEFQDENDPLASTAFANYLLPEAVIGGDTLTASSLVRQQWLDNHFYGMTFSANHDNRKKLKLTFGGGANQYLGDHYGDVIWIKFNPGDGTRHRWYDNQGIKTDINAFGKINYSPVKKISLFGDLQWRYVSQRMEGEDAFLRNIGQTHSFHFFNPKAGMYFDLGKMHKAYWSFAISNREPNRNNFADADPMKPLPVAEKLYDVEIGYELFHPVIAANVNLFYMNYHNQLVLTGEINDVGYPVMSNVLNSYRAGVEITASLTPKKWFRWDMNLALSSNRIKGFTEYIDAWDSSGNYYQQINDPGNTAIAFSPSLLGGSQMYFTITKGLEFCLINKYVGRQYIDNTSNMERSLDPYVIHSAMITYTIKTRFIKELEFKFLLNNFLNHQYESNAWVYRYIYDGEEYTSDGYFPQAGINFIGGITLRF